MKQVFAIAGCALLEARRTRLPLLLAVAVGLLLALSFFVAELAVTESARMQTGLYAAGARLAAVFLVAAHVIGSITREFDDKGLDVLLSLDVPRPHYILGKLAGFMVLAAAIALAATAPLALFAPAAAALQWGVALALELAVVAALALFCVITFGQFIPAAAFVLAFYLLARSLTAIRLMSAHPLSGADALSHQVADRLIEALALVTPSLDRWTQTAWLVNATAEWDVIGRIFFEAAVYLVLLAAAAMFDFQRRNF